MTGSSRSAGVGPLLAVGAATVIMAALTMRNARRAVELAEYRAEYLRREQARLVALLREERRMLQEEMEREREQHQLEARLQEERSSRELSLSRHEQERLAEEIRHEREQHLVELRRHEERSKREQDRLAEKLRREREQHQEAQQRARHEREGRERERSARLETEARIEHLEREIRRLQEAQRESVALVPAGQPEARLEAPTEPRKPAKARPAPPRDARASVAPKRPESPAGAAPKPARVPPRGRKPGRGVWHPHPDDGKGEDVLEKRDRQPVGAPVEMYRKHYDKYLENYRGYVELAEELYRMRGEGKVADGSLGEREWEERLRRILDGIERTTARLDILEQHNPELVTDARISHRASVARMHARLGQQQDRR